MKCLGFYCFFNRLTEPPYKEKLKSIEHKLFTLEEERHETGKLLNQQLSQLNFIAKKLVSEVLDELNPKPGEIEQLMVELKNKSQAVKKALFGVIEEVIEDDELYNK